MLRLFFPVLVLLTLCVPARADITAGERAYFNKEWINAITELRPLAEAGDSRALFLLGNMYNEGNGVVKNHVEAMRLYTRAAEKHNTAAMLSIASMYQGGIGFEKDLARANQWFGRAAALGDHHSMLFYAASLMRGDFERRTFPQDIAGAYKWFKIAASRDDGPNTQRAAADMAKAISGRLSATQRDTISRQLPP